MLRLPHHWTWDFWLADDGECYHLFFLKAPRALGDPDARHWNVTIGHAVSEDLRHWGVVEDALRPGPGPAFDDKTTWTGSVVRAPDGSWCMFYTGTSEAEGGLKQRIGLATSADLYRWTKQPGVLLESDPRWYETLPDAQWPDEAFRDPWVFADPAGDGWHMLMTARAATGPPDDRGVIGHARSRDLVGWEVHPPLSEPGAGFGHLEVPQVEVVDGRPVLLFSCLTSELSAPRRALGIRGGTWSVAADAVTGAFDVSAAVPLVDESMYSGRLVRDRDRSWVLLAFHHVDPAGQFLGYTSDPLPVSWTGVAPGALTAELPTPADTGRAASS